MCAFQPKPAKIALTSANALLEPIGLFKDNKGQSPGDVVLLLDHFFSDTHRLARWAITAIDVVTYTIPPMVPNLVDQQYEKK